MAAANLHVSSLGFGPLPPQVSATLLFAGVDPDREGGIVVLTAAGELVRAQRTPLLGPANRASSLPDHSQIGGLLEGVFHLAVEKLTHVPRRFVPAPDGAGEGTLGALPSDARIIQPGSRGSARKGIAWGMWMGAAGVLRLKLTLVHPRTWQAGLLRDKPKGREAIKASAWIRSRELFPDLPLPRAAKAGGKWQGLADAALIAEYGRRTYLSLQ